MGGLAELLQARGKPAAPTRPQAWSTALPAKPLAATPVRPAVQAEGMPSPDVPVPLPNAAD
eukprot:m.112620 g.112620  ORF g.112620 m.112620 type:complete len:61 (+) comp9121_c0_seq1:3116-3298(+)